MYLGTASAAVAVRKRRQIAQLGRLLRHGSGRRVIALATHLSGDVVMAASRLAGHGQAELEIATVGLIRNDGRKEKKRANGE